MTSATEELRRLLDERGVEWSAPSGLNARYADSMTFIGNTAVISEIDGSDLLRINFDGTPEQAIDATLDGVGSEVGSEVTSEVRGGKLTAEQVREAIERNVTFYEGGDYDAQEIADELNTMLGSGECTPHGEWKSISQTQEVRHVFCECGFELGMDRRDSFPFECTRLFAMPNFCQECGRKIRKAVKR